MPRRLSYITIALIVADAVIIIGSWVASVLWGETRSLLTEEGIRLVVGGFAAMVASPPLVWIMLAGMAFGACRGVVGGVGEAADATERYARRMSLYVALFVAAVLVAVSAAMVLAPHAVLLNATGGVAHSSASAALVPMLAFIAAATASTYGLCTGRYASMHDVLSAMSRGLASAAPYIIIYIFLAVGFRLLLYVAQQ